MTHDLSALKGLEKRLSEAKGPGRELDARIIHALFGDARFMLDAGNYQGSVEATYGVNSDFKIDEWGHASQTDWDVICLELSANISLFQNSTATHLTASIDAAIALCERVLPGWQCGFEKAGRFDANNLCEAWCWPYEDNFEPDWQNGHEGYRSCENAGRGAAPTPALALCHAIVRALIQQAESA